MILTPVEYFSKILLSPKNISSPCQGETFGIFPIDVNVLTDVLNEN